MTRIWTEGFEMGDIVGIPGTGAVSSATKRTGNYSLLLDSKSNTLTLASAIAEFYIRVAFYISVSIYTAPYIKWFNGTTEIGSIRINSSTFKLEIYSSTSGTTLVATGSKVFSPNQWYLLEAHVSIADSGTIETKIDGIAEVDWDGDTKPGSDTNINKFIFFGHNLYIDDLALNDTGGGNDNSWCGDGKIVALWPDETISAQLTGSDGNQVDNHLLVDEKPLDSDTTYVQGSVVDERDLYGFGAIGLADADYVFNRIWAEARAKDTAASGGTMALVTKASGGSEVEGGTRTLTMSYDTRVLSAEQLVNPVDSQAWQAADIDAIQAGPKTKS